MQVLRFGRNSANNLQPAVNDLQRQVAQANETIANLTVENYDLRANLSLQSTSQALLDAAPATQNAVNWVHITVAIVIVLALQGLAVLVWHFRILPRVTRFIRVKSIQMYRESSAVIDMNKAQQPQPVKEGHPSINNKEQDDRDIGRFSADGENSSDNMTSTRRPTAASLYGV